MRKKRSVLQYAIYLPTLMMVGLWLASKSRPGGWDVTVPQALTQVTALVALNLFGILLLIASRSRSIERIYGGLDKSYRLHGQLGRVGFILMVLHPLLLIPHYLMTGKNPVDLFWFTDFWPRNVGIVSFYLFILLIAITLYRKLEYQQWLTTHKFLGIPFVLACIHTLNANSDVKAYEPLRDWVVFWFIVGTLAWLYKTLFYEKTAKKYRYAVAALEGKGRGIWELRLRPTGARMNFEPGEFAFISVRGNPAVPTELHPFSISSDPVRHQVRFSFREAGDFTRKLTQTQEGDEVIIYGPYGEFTSFNFDASKRQVWIAGGIGITPFLSMLSHESLNGDPKHVTLIYGVKSKEDAVYADEIDSLVAGHEDEIRVIQHCSDDQGFLTADFLAQELGDLNGTLFLMCGPPIMMNGIKKGLIARGVSPDQIDFEEFNFV